MGKSRDWNFFFIQNFERMIFGVFFQSSADFVQFNVNSVM